MKKLLLVLVLILVACQVKEVPMAVSFDATNGQGIQFGSIAAVNNLPQKSISCWFYLNAYGNGHSLVDKWAQATYDGWSIYESPSPITSIYFVQGFTGGTNAWYLNSMPATSAWHHLVVTYDNTKYTNDPIFYLDGSVYPITLELPRSTGTAKAETSNIELGYDSSNTNSTINGKLSDIRIYNRIISADEVTTLFDNQNKHVVQNGLVFWSPFVGTAGATAFDNMTLTSSNKLIDIVSGTYGTPSGSPKGSTTISLFGGNSADTNSVAQTATGTY